MCVSVLLAIGYKTLVSLLILIKYFLGKENVGSVTLRQIYEIAQLKSQDAGFKNTPLIGVCRSIIHTAHSVGLNVINDQDGDGPLPEVKKEAATA